MLLWYNGQVVLPIISIIYSEINVKNEIFIAGDLGSMSFFLPGALSSIKGTHSSLIASSEPILLQLRSRFVASE